MPWKHQQRKRERNLLILFIYARGVLAELRRRRIYVASFAISRSCFRSFPIRARFGNSWTSCASVQADRCARRPYVTTLPGQGCTEMAGNAVKSSVIRPIQANRSICAILAEFPSSNRARNCHAEWNSARRCGYRLFSEPARGKKNCSRCPVCVGTTRRAGWPGTSLLSYVVYIP